MESKQNTNHVRRLVSTLVFSLQNSLKIFGQALKGSKMNCILFHLQIWASNGEYFFGHSGSGKSHCAWKEKKHSFRASLSLAFSFFSRWKFAEKHQISAQQQFPQAKFPPFFSYALSHFLASTHSFISSPSLYFGLFIFFRLFKTFSVACFDDFET